MKNHTKGPWKAENHDKSNHWLIRAKSPHAEGLSQIVCEINGPWDKNNYRANAKLIASSPELLEALENIVSIVNDGVIHRNETGKPQWSAFDEIKKITSAVLKKAKGSK